MLWMHSPSREAYQQGPCRRLAGRKISWRTRSRAKYPMGRFNKNEALFQNILVAERSSPRPVPALRAELRQCMQIIEFSFKFQLVLFIW